MNKKFLTIGLPILGGLLVAGVGIASAAGMMGGGAGGNGGPGPAMGFGAGNSIAMSSVTPAEWAADQATQFQNEATALGLSESVIISGWAQGQSLEQIATANGISSSQYKTDMETYAKSQQQADLAALVSQGTITSAQESDYLAAIATQEAAAQAQMTARMQNASGTWQGGGRGFGKMGGHGASSTVSTN